MVIGIIDIIVLVTLVISILVGLYRGLVAELLSISAWILAGFAALYSYVPMTPIMKNYIDNEKLAGPCGALLVALVVLIIVTIISAQITKRLRDSSLSGLDRLLGFIFGFIRAFLFISLIYIGVSMLLSEKQIKEFSKENVSIAYIEKSVHFLKYFVPENVQSDLKLSETVMNEEKPKKIGTDLKRIQTPKKSEQDSLKSLVKEAIKPATDQIKTKIEKKIVEPKKTEPVNYNSNERQSLDNMVESLSKGN